MKARAAYFGTLAPKEEPLSKTMTNMSSASQLTPSRGEFFEIRIGQHLDSECSAWLAGLVITNLEGGEAILSGFLADQAALFGVLKFLGDLNVPLIEVKRGHA
jgi:hypothetical protein